MGQRKQRKAWKKKGRSGVSSVKSINWKYRSTDMGVTRESKSLSGYVHRFESYQLTKAQKRKKGTPAEKKKSTSASVKLQKGPKKSKRQ